MKTKLFVLLSILLFGISAFAQNGGVKMMLIEKGSDEPVGFATVSLTVKGQTKAYKYALSTDYGAVVIDFVKKGTYILKAELLGYKTVEKEITITNTTLDLGKIIMETDRQQLEAAKVSAIGNAILIKKDTIEYNASSFKTTDNDVLEDLLKKLPGVEIAEDGGITVNGETIKKITINGKTFFLDDPQLASKNIPAKIINKLKVIDKKSDQAEFTGIDDGENETVIDLSIKPGMMKGAFGNIMGGAGHDIPADNSVKGDFRYQGAGFLGKFTDKQQLSVILNGNNTNNRGFNDLSGSMMGNMRGAGGGRGRGQGGWGRGNGITTSYMAGANGAWTLCDGNMDLSSNYLFNRTEKDVLEKSIKTVYQKNGEDLVYKSGGENDGSALNSTISNGHRIGMRLDHKFSKNTSILFEPRINFGTGNYLEDSRDTTFLGSLGGQKVNSAYTKNIGQNKNVDASAFMLFRQRLGMPGRTLTVMGRFGITNNDLDGENHNGTTLYDGTGNESGTTSVDQRYTSNAKTLSGFARATYTEPLGGHFYVEANYAFRYARSTSEKETTNLQTNEIDYQYSNNITNSSITHEFGANALYQTEKFRAQIGLGAMPNLTENETTKYNSATGKFEPMVYNSGFRWNWAPSAMAYGELGENCNLRLFYRGRTNQPSTSKLMPVPDNTDPLNVSFGNPSLLPNFQHNINGDFRYNNKEKFSSFTIRLNGSITQNPVVNTIWYDGGSQYSMPFNCSKPSVNLNVNGFCNIPIAKSNFSFSNMLRVGWNESCSYVGTNIDMDTYRTKGYYEFMDEFIKNFNDEAYFDANISENVTKTLSLIERLRFTYRADNLELQLSGRTRYNHSWYTLADTKDRTSTFNNQVRFNVNWTWETTGITFKSEFNYNWYNGYTTAQPSEYILDAELQKSLLKNKLTLSIKGYDLLGQAKNLNVTDEANYHMEAVNNTLGRYIVATLTYRFGAFDKSKMRGGMGMRGPRM